jgi:cytochrome c oxidase cbb3-type subunit 1
MERAVSVLWLLGMAFASLYYVVPRAADRPLASGGAAMLAWAAWLIFSAASALAALTDTSVPFIITTLGGTATILLAVPVLLTAGVLAATMHGRWTLLFGTGPAAMAAVAVAFLFATSLLDAVGVLRGVEGLVGGTDWETGLFVWAMYGSFTLAAFAIAEHALPRIMRRAWSNPLLSGAQLWLAFGGATIAGLALMGGGIAEGSLIAQGATADTIEPVLVVYRAIAFAGFGLVAVAGLAMVVNTFLMYTSGEPVEPMITGQPAAAAAGH